MFNFEGGCYAKVINLSAELEPQIYADDAHFGTVLENVVIDPATRELDLADDSLTENTRAAYPLTSLTNAVPSGGGGHPKHIVMLTADAFGVLPPIARMTVPQAMYHFLSGYTAKVAGTEKVLPSLRRRSRTASVRRSWCTSRRCTRSCWANASRATK